MKEYENGEVVSTKGSREAGLDVQPGTRMQADPKVGQPDDQEHYPGEAMDKARVRSLKISVTVPLVRSIRRWKPGMVSAPNRLLREEVRRMWGWPLGSPADLALEDVKENEGRMCIYLSLSI